MSSNTGLTIETQLTSMDTIAQLVRVTLEAGAAYTLNHPKGRSMYPVIITETDSVVLDKPNDLKVYDAVLFRRKSGAYVLHRIIGIDGDTFTVCGDNQTFTEKAERGQIIAKLTAIIREENGVRRSIPADDAALQKQIRAIYRKKKFIFFYYKVRHTVGAPIKKLLGIGKGTRKA